MDSLFDRSEFDEAGNLKPASMASLKEGDHEEASGESRKPLHKLFDRGVLERAKKAASDDTKAVLEQLASLKAWRELAEIPDDYERVCSDLEDNFPNFGGFIHEHLGPQLALASLSEKRAFKLSPVLFVGPPGIGKTTFCEAFSKALSLPFDRINLESAQAGFEVTGVARGWTNAGPGRLMRWLATPIPVNGVFVMEELDKARGDGRFDVKASLLQILEDRTARAFGDQSMPEVKFDVSPVNFVFTANSLEGLSKPLLDRMTVVEIPAMTVDQARDVARRQYALLLDELKLPIDPPDLTEEALDTLSGESPRRQSQMLRYSLGRAVYERKSILSVTPTRPEAGRRIGFI